MAETTETWVCRYCGYEYHAALGDPDEGVPAGTAFADIPDDWSCPNCGSDKSEFERT